MEQNVKTHEPASPESEKLRVKLVIEDGIISSLRCDRPDDLDVEVFYLDDDSVTYEQDLMAVAYMMQDPAFQPVRYHEHGQDPEDV